MLVLARKVGERLRIGDSIEIVVVEVKGDTVRLGLTAPRGVAIYRQEIYEAIQRENQAASQTPLDLTSAKNTISPLKFAPSSTIKYTKGPARDGQLSGKEAADKNQGGITNEN